MSASNSIDFQAFTSPGYIIGALAILFAVLSVGQAIYNVYFHPLSKYPGPKLYAATHIPQSWLWINGKEHVVLKEMHEEYGEVVRDSPDSLSYTGFQAWKDISGYRPGMKQIPKDDMFYLGPTTSGVRDIITSDDANHSRFRRCLSNAFSDKALRSSESILNTYFNLLITKLKDRASSPETSVVNLTAWYNWATFDIIGDLAFGQPFHALDNGAYHPFITMIFKAIQLSRIFRALRQYKLDSVIFNMSKLISKLHPGFKKALKGMERDYASQIIAERLSPDRKMTERQDFMFHILRQEEGKGMSRDELIKNAAVLVIAGSETTATFLSGTTYLLLKNPDVLKTLTDEVRNAFKSADEITLASTVSAKMPYLHAVIEEGLRVYPPVPNKLPRRTISGITINGAYVPPNTSIGIHQLSSSHSARTFHEPERFVPSRWLPSPPAPYDKDQLDAHQPFSIGPRNCLGRNLAYGEMRSILARMIWNFDLSFAKDEEGKVVSEAWDQQQKTYSLWVKPPLWIDLKLREA